MCALQAMGGAAWAAPSPAAQPEGKPSVSQNEQGRPVQVAALDTPVTVGFNTAFLYGMTSTADLRSLLAGTGVPPGIQRVDLYMNQTLAGRLDVEFSLNEKTGDVEPCFTAQMLVQAGVDLAKLPNPPDKTETCIRLPDVAPDASVVYDMANLRLTASMPQTYMTSLHRGYIDPSLWDSGANVGFLNYSLNVRQNHARGRHSGRDLTASLRSGVNIGAWRLRNDSFLTSGSGRQTRFKSQNTYLQRGFSSIKSQMVLGETYTYSSLFDSFRFLGMQLASDDAMRPDDEQGYAPVVRGSADSNATIEIRQNGYLIYTTSVSPGPFAITDLQPSGANGDLEITIIEANGSRRTLRQAFSSPPLMVRQGRVKYDVAAGQIRLNDRLRERPNFLGGSMIYGVTADTSIAAGAQASSGYQSISLGAGLNTRLGAISVDGIHSRSDSAGAKTSGDRVNLRYAKFVEATGSNVSVNVQRGLREGFSTLSDHVQRRQNRAGSRWNLGSGTRQRVDASLAQPVGRGYVYLNGSYGKNWDDTSSRSLSLAYNNTVGKVTYNLSYSQSRNVYASWRGGSTARRDNTLMLTLSIPLGSQGNSSHAFATMSRQSQGTSAQAGVSGLLPIEREVTYTVTGSRDADGQYDGSIGMGTATSFGRLSASYTQGSQYRASNFSASGSVVAHAGGVNLGQGLGETFLLAKVEPPVSGVAVSSFAGVETGRNGYAIIPSATPFRGNWVSINTEGLAKNIDIHNGMQLAVPTRGAAGLVEFKADTGRRVQFELRTAEGKPLPFGATVDDWDGRRLGITDPRGRVLTLLPGDREHGEIDVRWSGATCRVAYALPPKVEGENYQRLTLECAQPIPPVLDQDVPGSLAIRKPGRAAPEAS
ncbi:fimbria/pilus outer membrane usher protein [Achromobacter sp. RTa]|uniref:fimbria/pilus outer membrane usher protein n=1 Tax=Achromobacter sp. RTa TaxID=1532557 RepID=UPI001E360332|nr:fimbria/pilus outer membrane usher protein [Achromobacter sp. RTa]